MNEPIIPVPPHSIHAEVCVLGSMILKPSSMQEAVASVDPCWFYRPVHEEIFKVLQGLATDNINPDLVIVKEAMGDRLEDIGGADYLTNLVSGVPNADSISHYAGIIKDKYTKRQLIVASNSIRDMAYSESVSATDALGEAYTVVQSAGEHHQQRRRVSAGSAMASMLEHVESVQAGHIKSSLSTGFPDLDRQLTGGGVRPGSSTIIAGRPGRGKSMVANDMARNMATNGDGALIVSGEMTAQEIMERHASAMTGIFAGKIANGYINVAERNALDEVMLQMQHWQLDIIDAPCTISEIAAEAKMLNNRWYGNLKCVIVDYLGLMKPDSTSIGREQQVGAMARQCKVYAQTMGIPWIVLHQLNRAGASGRPEMHQLRDSGQLEEHANTVLLLDWNDEEEIYEAPALGGPYRQLLIRIAKQRGGMATSWSGSVSRKLRGCLTRTERWT